MQKFYKDLIPQYIKMAKEVLEPSLKERLNNLDSQDALKVIILPKEDDSLDQVMKYLNSLGVKQYESIGGSVFAEVTVDQVYSLAKQDFVSYLSQEAKEDIENLLD